jgi:SAM-dependent methyltransferase
MSERWKNYFIRENAFGKDWLSTAVSHWGFHEKLYGMILKYCPTGSKLLDVGCGPGWSDIYLSSLGYSVTGIDNEATLIDLAKVQNNRFETDVEFKICDAFDLSPLENRYDLSFSCGVLEHFDRDVTVALLKEQAKYSNYVLIQIPTKYTKYSGGITDERIYTISELSKIVQDSGLDVVAKFGYGDVCVTKIHKVLRLFLPRIIYRVIQNKGFSFAIAVIGKTNEK